MVRICCLLLVVLSLISLAFGARSNVCLAAGATVYKPLQLYPSNCPNNASNCMAAVYNYKPALFLSQGPSTLKPGNREAFVYMTQDESDNFDVVIEAVTTYANTIINAKVEVIGAVPNNANILLKDDPTEDTWQWNPSNNTGAFKWLLQPGYTDGVVLGHFQLVDNYCFRATFLPNWAGSIANVIFLSGNVTKPVRVITKPLVGNSTVSTYFEFCQYPQAIITKTDASCYSGGSASAYALNGTATYLWKKGGVTVGTTSTISGLSAGTYSVLVTVAGCSVTRSIDVVNNEGNSVPLAASTTSTAQTRTSPGSIALSVSGGNPPYLIWWKNAAGMVIATNVTSVSVAAGEYDVVVGDGCQIQTYHVVVAGPQICPPGTKYDSVDGCLPCPIGTFSTANDASECTVCPPGSWNNVVNATSCNVCPANTYSSGGTDVCTNCAANYVSDAASGVCVVCTPGTDRAVGATSCTACAPGYFRCDPAVLCAPCDAGSFGGNGQSCELCDPGTYQNQTGQTSCISCPANRYSAAGASSCSYCPSGTVAPAHSTVLVACAAI